MEYIIAELSGIDKTDLTLAELNIARHLIELGLAQWKSEDGETYLMPCK